MAGMANIDKQKVIVCKFFRDAGWVEVYGKDSGVFTKGKFVFIVREKDVDFTRKPVTESQYAVNVVHMTHQTGVSWKLEYEGFLIASEKVPECFLRYYELQAQGGDVSIREDDCKQFVSKINDYTQKSVNELNSLKRKEVVLDGLENAQISPMIVSDVLDVNRFLVANDAIKNPIIEAAGLDSQKVYAFTVDGDNVYLQECNPQTFQMIANTQSTLGKAAFMQLIENRLITGLGISVVPSAKSKLEYVPLFEGVTATLPDSFADFNLAKPISNLVTQALATGLNPTPLLSNYGLQKSKVLFSVLTECEKNSLDTECLVNKELEVEHYAFLNKLAMQGIPLDIFIDDYVSVEDLQNKYNGVSSTFSMRVDELGLVGSNRKPVYNMLFKYRDPDVVDAIVEKVKNTTTAVEAELCVMLAGPNKDLAQIFLTDGVIQGQACNVMLHGLSEAKLQKIRNAFTNKQLTIDGKSWCDVFEKCLSRAVTIAFYKGKFILPTDAYSITADYNSACIQHGVDTIWRCLLINGKSYEYKTDKLTHFLGEFYNA